MLEITNKSILLAGREIVIKQEYLNHEFVSGNKWRKLKYNLIEAKAQDKKVLLTFGGAFSNHISAVAAAGKAFGFKTIGVIRGEELETKVNDNPTLSFARSCGMDLNFVTRADYKKRASNDYIEELKNSLGDFYLVPEGGTNALAIKGCEEILTEKDTDFDYICCPVGTGGTLSGIINSSLSSQQVLGFPALKGDFLSEDISRFATQDNWKLITDYHFGGYAKINAALIAFINEFNDKYDIPLDPVYTGKMLFGIYDLIKKGYFKKGSKILVIHTGGLQGIAGMNVLLKKKNLPLINI